MGGQRRMDRLCYKKERVNTDRSAYRRIEKNGESFFIRGKEWTQIQEKCL